MEMVLSMKLRGLRKPMDAVKASMGDLIPLHRSHPAASLRYASEFAVVVIIRKARSREVDFFLF